MDQNINNILNETMQLGASTSADQGATNMIPPAAAEAEVQENSDGGNEEMNDSDWKKSAYHSKVFWNRSCS